MNRGNHEAEMANHFYGPSKKSWRVKTTEISTCISTCIWHVYIYIYMYLYIYMYVYIYIYIYILGRFGGNMYVSADLWADTFRFEEAFGYVIGNPFL